MKYLKSLDGIIAIALISVLLFHFFQALGMMRPADLYTPSTRKYEGLPDVS